MENQATKVYGYGTKSAKAALEPVVFDRPTIGANEVAFKVSHCGVCHSDVHQAKNDWGGTQFPCVPGHEVVGNVTSVGSDVTDIKVGDLVGVGCMIDGCHECDYCENDEENYCHGPKGATMTYNGSLKPDGKNTYGGYSTDLVANKDFIIRVPDCMDAKYAGPIMCAGITVYSPMKHWDLKKGQTLGVAGIGGLGHMAIKIGKALGAHITAFTRDSSKTEEILKMGADTVVISTNEEEMKEAAETLDMLINTIPVPHDIGPYIELMKTDSHIIVVGNMVSFPEFSPGPLVMNRISLSGSLIGGIKETQEVLDLCAKHDIRPSIKMIEIDEVNDVFEKLANGDAEGHFRHVIDMDSLRNHKSVKNDKAAKIEDPSY